MNFVQQRRSTSLVKALSQGGVAVIPTDTVYGLVGRADDTSACERVFELKGRDVSKKCIILIASIDDIYDQTSKDAFSQALEVVDTRPTSIVVPAGDKTPPRLVSSDGTIAYRMPHDSALIKLLEQTGPLIAPSANPEGLPPALTIDQAKAYFGTDIDWYQDGGDVSGRVPSRIIHMSSNGGMEIIR